MRRTTMAGVRAVKVASALALCVPAYAQDDAPDLDFLEYLGSWEEEDESWYVEVQLEEPGDADASPQDNAPKELRAEHEDD